MTWDAAFSEGTRKHQRKKGPVNGEDAPGFNWKNELHDTENWKICNAIKRNAAIALNQPLLSCALRNATSGVCTAGHREFSLVGTRSMLAETSDGHPTKTNQQYGSFIRLSRSS